MNTLWHDVRFGARMLAKNPGFPVVAVLTLALGIGAVTPIFSAVYAVLPRLLPYPEPYHLMRVWRVDCERAVGNLSDPNFEEGAAVVLLGMVAGVYGIGAPRNVLRGLRARRSADFCRSGSSFAVGGPVGQLHPCPARYACGPRDGAAL
jgi:hypothetical protein